MMNEQSESQAKHDCYCAGAGPRFTKNVRDMSANMTAEHFRKAGVELLKGFRSILDVGIDRLSKDPSARGTTVNVD